MRTGSGWRSTPQFLLPDTSTDERNAARSVPGRDALQVSITLERTTTFLQVEVTERMSALQLVSAILGLVVGVLGGYRFAWTTFEGLLIGGAFDRCRGRGAPRERPISMRNPVADPAKI